MIVQKHKTGHQNELDRIRDKGDTKGDGRKTVGEVMLRYELAGREKK